MSSHLTTDETSQENSKWPKHKMEFDDDFLKDSTRFCFLLGSALRNCDSDQFVQVYDSVIPSNYSEDQVNICC